MGEDNFCNIHTSYVPVCPFLEVYNGSMFSHSNCSTGTYITKSIMASVRANGLIEATANQPYIEDVTMYFVKSSSILFRQSREKCDESAKAWKSRPKRYGPLF